PISCPERGSTPATVDTTAVAPTAETPTAVGPTAVGPAGVPPTAVSPALGTKTGRVPAAAPAITPAPVAATRAALGPAPEALVPGGEVHKMALQASPVARPRSSAVTAVTASAAAPGFSSSAALESASVPPSSYTAASVASYAGALQRPAAHALRAGGEVVKVALRVQARPVARAAAVARDRALRGAGVGVGRRALEAVRPRGKVVELAVRTGPVARTDGLAARKNVEKDPKAEKDDVFSAKTGRGLGVGWGMRAAPSAPPACASNGNSFRSGPRLQNQTVARCVVEKQWRETGKGDAGGTSRSKTRGGRNQPE
ncbi:MAG: hypothetical protein BJ554DRAFT_2342, partial [Olpidium bornovanus]